MAVKWIIADVDGCITPEESVAWDLDLFSQFAQTVRGGALPPMTLCTGRPQPYVEVLMKLFDIDGPAICENGAVFYSLHDNHAWYGPGVTEAKIIALRELRMFVETEVLPEEPDAFMQFGKEAQFSVFSKKPDIFPRIQNKIDAFLQDHKSIEVVVTASHYYLNVSLGGVDKGNALRELVKELGVEPNEVVGIGDTAGDMPLRDNVGFFAAPANAQPAIKSVADYISPYQTLEGMLDILQHKQITG